MVQKTIISDSPFGFKQRRTAEIELPDGWYRVLSGAVIGGDRHINSALFWADGIVDWLDVDAKDIADPVVNNEPGYFDCLIRRGLPCERECDMCHEEPCPVGWKYCRACAKSSERRKVERVPKV